LLTFKLSNSERKKHVHKTPDAMQILKSEKHPGHLFKLVVTPSPIAIPVDITLRAHY
jgi:hypothetical protein